MIHVTGFCSLSDFPRVPEKPLVIALQACFSTLQREHMLGRSGTTFCSCMCASSIFFACVHHHVKSALRGNKRKSGIIKARTSNVVNRMDSELVEDTMSANMET